MLRRVVSSRTALPLAARSVSSYNFGQPDNATEFLPASHYPTKGSTTDGGVRVSQLPSGVRVITHDTQGPHVAVGTYIAAGPKFDPVGLPGLSHVLRYSLSTSNLQDSAFQLDRSARSVGAAIAHVEVRKRFIGLKVEAGAGNWERVAQDQWNTIAAPRFAENDLEKFRDHMDAVREEQRFQSPREYCIQQLEGVAFNREALGNPRLVTPEFNDKCDRSKLLEQWTRLCVPNRIVVAGVNVDHDLLIAAYENTVFKHSAEAPHHARAEAAPHVDETSERDQYYPGNEVLEPEFRVKVMATKPDGQEEAIFALGFLAPGADDNVKLYAAGLVTRELASIAFGETLNVNRHSTRYGIESFYTPFSSAGLIGATVRADPYDAKAAIEQAGKALKNLPTDPASLALAKTRAAARFAADHLEVARDYVDFLGSSLVKDSINSVTAHVLLDAIASVESSNVHAVTTMIKSSGPTLFGTGDVLAVPTLRKLSL